MRKSGLSISRLLFGEGLKYFCKEGDDRVNAFACDNARSVHHRQRSFPVNFGRGVGCSNVQDMFLGVLVKGPGNRRVVRNGDQ